MEFKRKTLDKQNVSFTIQHTQIAKGIAILLMVYHHLFVIPERLNCAYFALPNVFGYDVQSVIANFSKICVCIFVFLSGIGLYYSLYREKSMFAMYKKVGLKALSFMMNFWVIALLVYPIGLMMGFFTLDFDCIIKVVFADYPSVMEWWFVRQYIVLLILAPIFVGVFSNKSYIGKVIPVLIICVFWLSTRLLIKYGYIDLNSIFISYFWYFENIPCLLTFIVGIITAKFDLFSLYLNIPHNKLFSLLCVIMCCLCRFAFSNNPTSMEVDLFVVPLFVFGITTLIIKTHISKLLEYFAKHSTNIWLTHTFWCYYFFQNIVIKPYYSILIYIWLLGLSLLSSYIINLIYVPINNWLFSKEHKLSYENYFFLLMVK